MPAGFCLVREGSVLDPKAPIRTVAELFVPRSFRRLGIGRALALAGFRRFPGRWEVREAEANEPAQAFWREVIGAYTAGAFVELALADGRWRGPVQTFDNSLMLG
jgi:predicted acetyltransferase